MDIQEIIASKNPETEQAYIKFPREGPIKISSKGKEFENGVELNKEEINNYYLQRRKKFAIIHTHPHKPYRNLSAIPSDEDLINFYVDSRRKSSILIQRDFKNGKIMGYTFVTKSETDIPEEILNYDRKNRRKLFPEDSAKIEEFENKIRNYGDAVRKDFRKYKKELSDVLRELNFKIRFVPEKNYFFNDESGSFEYKFLKTSKNCWDNG